MAIEQGIPQSFDLPPGISFYLGDPSTEFSGEEQQTQAAVRFSRFSLPPIATHTRGIFVQGRFAELSKEQPDASWGGWSVFVRVPHG